MSIPVSKYEELLRTVRGLGQEARHVQSLASPLLSSLQEDKISTSTNQNLSAVDQQQPSTSFSSDPDIVESNLTRNNGLPPLPIIQQNKVLANSRNVNNIYSKSKLYKKMAKNEHSRSYKNSEQFFENNSSIVNNNSAEHNVTTSSGPLSNLYHGTWPVERGPWQSGPSSLPSSSNNEVTSVISFASSAGSTGLFESLNSNGDNISASVQSSADACSSSYSTSNTEAQTKLGAKVDIVYGLLAMLGANEGADMGHTLLALSSSPESCLAMRKSGCIPLLVQLVHSECDSVTRQQASQALYNLVQSQSDERLLRRETRVLKLLEQIRTYCDNMMESEDEIKSDTSNQTESTSSDKVDNDKHPTQIIANLMKLSFDEGHRIAICQLGGLQAIAKLIQVDHLVHGSNNEDAPCITLRRYSGMALTNLTFGDGNNKALLCSLHDFMQVLVKQLYSKSEDLKQVTASVLRNLSWRADSQSKQILREVGAVIGLAEAAMNSEKEATLKSVLSALWNLSAHCSINKADICSVDGLLAYLVNMLSYKSPSKTLSIVENAGGILRNISSHIAVREDYRVILREHNCLQILLQQLRSPSLTVVSNACGSLWNLSAKCSADQIALWNMGAVPMLRSLTHSKHKMISMGSSAALKNLLSARPNGGSLSRLDSTAKALGLTELPTLGARRQRALEQELDQNLSETCDNIEPSTSPTNDTHFNFSNNELHLGRILASHSYTQENNKRKNDGVLSESRESVTSTHSDSVYERCIRALPKKGTIKVTNKLSQSDTLNTSIPSTSSTNKTDFKFIKRYENACKDKSSLNYVRNKFSDCITEDDQGQNDNPVDYSKKYNEINTKVYEVQKLSSESSKNKVEVAYGNYAVTDLDQPTNYSLRYAEGDGEDQPKAKKDSIFESEFVHEDTIKTYCTEGTPYETPFNFSTATSMSDLRLDTHKIDNDFVKIDTKSTKEHESRHMDEKDSCSVEDITKIDNSNKLTSNYKSNFSSGILSPEKPINYCEEGTPGCFSRVSSLSSLHSMSAVNETILQKDEKKVKLTDKVDNDKTASTSSATVDNRIDRECKVVTFGGAINYAEETPLMFSRSSSLASLDSVEQHSIHDDRSSVVSDFSRRTSGVVSPSELPDSPTQTVPSTPLRPEVQRVRKISSTPLRNNSNSNISPPTVVKRSVFEDATSSFKDESTPIEFSRATSLSSLTIDDEVKLKDSTSSKTSSKHIEEISEQMNNMMLTNSPKQSTSGIPIPKRKSNISRMRTRPPPPPSLLIKKQTDLSSHSRNLESTFDTVKTYFTEDTPAVLSHAGSNSNLSELSIPIENENKSSFENVKVSDDFNKTNSSDSKCKENNKSHESSFDLSDVGSNNNSSSDELLHLHNRTLPQSNFANNAVVEDLEDDSSNNSADERLLQQCIQAGMNRVTSTAHSIPPIVKNTSKQTLDDDDAPAFSDDSYTSADERLLQQCIKAGMARVASNPCVDPINSQEVPKLSSEVKLEQEKEFSDDGSINSAEEQLLANCIKFGFERTTSHSVNISSDKSKGTEKLFDNYANLEGDCIKKRVEEEDNASITSADERLLSECINLGIQSVTGVKPQIPSAIVQQSRKTDERPKLEKRSRSMGFVKYESQELVNRAEIKKNNFEASNLNHSENFDRNVNIPHSGTFSKTSTRMSSTMSLDSMASLTETEKALLQQCIQAGIARTTGQQNVTERQKLGAIRPENRKPFGAERESEHCLKQFDMQLQMHPAYRESLAYTTRNVCRDQSSSQNRQEYNSMESKNVDAPPVTVNTVVAPEEKEEEEEEKEVVVLYNNMNHPHTFHQVTGAENDFVGNEIQRPICNVQDSPIPYPDICGKLPEESIHRIVNSWTGEMKNGFENDNLINLSSTELKKRINKSLSSLLDSSVENNEELSSNSTDCVDGISFENVYGKPRDPDAMIASVDRLTAELVSHASHLHADRLMKQSTQDTWNDSTSSTTDLTFPSISTTAPVLILIKSETDQDSSLPKEEINLSSLDTNYSVMTDSTIIAVEASKVVSAVQQEGALMQTSIGSVNLENVKPPSCMGSLVSLSSASEQYEGGNESLPKYKWKGNIKRRLSSTEMVRRAISNSTNHSGSLENLINQASGVSLTNSLNLDCIKPPSVMNDISDTEMENSMTSVASITSEVADSSLKPDFIPNGIITTDVFNMQNKVNQIELESKQLQSLVNFMAITAAGGSDFSDIENINPPSYFNNSISTAAENDATICDDTTDLFEDCITHNDVDPTLKTDTEYSDARSITPIPSDFALSSAESTPKKTNRVNKRLTSKQRRQLTKERYKTYTVAAGMVIQEEQKRQYETQISCPESYIDSGKASTIDTSDHKDTSSDCSEKRAIKLTPKQRRQEDRLRFQTQVLAVAPFNYIGNSENTSLDTDESIIDSHKLPNKKTLKQKRLENRDRFKTQTINDFSSSPDSSLPIIESTDQLIDDEMENIIQTGANLIVNKLNENIDEMLDCETISLVSNEDDNEHNSINSVNFRTYHKSWGFNSGIPVIDDQHLPSNTAEISSKIIKPKIVKPGDDLSKTTTNDVQEAPKAIRGRRKPLYSGQIKRTSTTKIIPKSTKINTLKSPQIKSSQIKPFSANLIPKRTITQPKAIVVPQSAATKPATVKPLLERQGTFVKEDCEVMNSSKTKIPVPSKLARPVTKPPLSKIPKSVDTSPKHTSKNISPIKKPLTKSSSVGSPTRPKSVPSTSNSRSSSTERESLLKRRSYGQTTSIELKNSASNQSLKSNKNIGQKNLTQRSYSNLSIPNVNVRKKPTATKEITSKIASLWKKVEVNRNKESTTKDNRVWISNDEAGPSSRLLRSSTFENTPKKKLPVSNEESINVPENILDVSSTNENAPDLKI